MLTRDVFAVANIHLKIGNVSKWYRPRI